MSYILEALKKSEYTRQQGRVPDLATLPAMDVGAGGESMRQRLPILAAGAVLLVVAAAGWWRPWQASAGHVLVAAPEAAAPPRQAPAPAPVAVVLPAPGQAVVAPAPSQTIPPPPVAAASPVVEAAPPTASSAPAPVPEPRAEIAPKAVLPELPPAPVERKPLPAAPREPAAAATAATATATPTAALPAPPQRVLGFYELPPVVRERIPPLAVSGFSYAEEAGMRLAVINDRVLRQGDSAAPGITLERINSDGVVLNFNGYRFRPQR